MRARPRLLAIAVVLVSLWRGWLLITGGGRDAPGEKKWWPSVYHGDVGSRFVRAKEALAPGEVVEIAVAPPGLDPNWWRVMGQYYLVEQTILPVSERPADPPDPAAQKRVLLLGDDVRVEPVRR